MEEVWKNAIYIGRNKEVIDFKGWYQVSNYGNVRSYRANTGGSVSNKRRKVPRLLTATRQSGNVENNYLRVSLKLEDKKCSYLIHRLVLSTFLKIPQHLNEEEFIDVNHIDENKENNNLLNLEWCSREENNLHGTRLERAIKNGMKTKRSEEWKELHKDDEKYNSRNVVGVELKSGAVVEFKSMTRASAFIGIKFADRSISATIRGKQKTAYGYKWYYKEDYEKLQCE